VLAWHIQALDLIPSIPFLKNIKEKEQKIIEILFEISFIE
jgi:hypothetical protein